MLRDTGQKSAYQAEKAEIAWAEYAKLAKLMANDPTLRDSKMMERLRSRAFNTFLERFV